MGVDMQFKLQIPNPPYVHCNSAVCVLSHGYGSAIQLLGIL